MTRHLQGQWRDSLRQLLQNQGRRRGRRLLPSERRSARWGAGARCHWARLWLAKRQQVTTLPLR
jgi:hypothetical protein